jgi:outer membrane protein assembly factor BamE (lipoprotein component of BamABCDE complex)
MIFGKTAVVLSMVCGLMFISGCRSTEEHQSQLHSTKEREMTVGVVQKEISVGMSQTDVAEALGSPNIVTRDNEGKEAWVYDKIATEASYSNSSAGVRGGVGVGVGGGNTLVLGGVGGGYSQASGASATTQKTLTVIIKFGADNLVESFSYHSSKF